MIKRRVVVVANAPLASSGFPSLRSMNRFTTLVFSVLYLSQGRFHSVRSAPRTLLIYYP